MTRYLVTADAPVSTYVELVEPPTDPDELEAAIMAEAERQILPFMADLPVESEAGRLITWVGNAYEDWEWSEDPIGGRTVPAAPTA